jgi:hypothetical protein
VKDGPGRRADYCSIRCRNAARYRRDAELRRLGAEVKSLFVKETDRG